MPRTDGAAAERSRARRARASSTSPDVTAAVGARRVEVGGIERRARPRVADGERQRVPAQESAEAG